jgi:hypothetical protein
MFLARLALKCKGMDAGDSMGLRRALTGWTGFIHQNSGQRPVGHSLRCDMMLVSIGHGYCLGKDWVIAARLTGYDVALVILVDFFFERCLSHSKMHRLGCVQKSDKAMCQINQNWSIPV